MKKILLICVLCLSLAACGKTAEPQPSGSLQTTAATVAAAAADDTLSNAAFLCQFVKDCLGEPDSFLIHGISHIEAEEHHYYYLDFSHQIKHGEMVRTYYYAEFEGATLLCILNEHSAIYWQTDGDYTVKYPVVSALFQEQSSEMLDVEAIATAQPSHEKYGVLQALIDSYGFPFSLHHAEDMSLTNIDFAEDHATREFHHSMENGTVHDDLAWNVTGNTLELSGDWEEAFTLDMARGTATSLTDGVEYRFVVQLPGSIDTKLYVPWPSDEGFTEIDGIRQE